jgi:hypothetical protein
MSKFHSDEFLAELNRKGKEYMDKADCIDVRKAIDAVNLAIHTLLPTSQKVGSIFNSLSTEDRASIKAKVEDKLAQATPEWNLRFGIIEDLKKLLPPLEVMRKASIGKYW